MRQADFKPQGPLGLCADVRMVQAMRRIEQCPTTSAPAVPAGSWGEVQDVLDEGWGHLLAVDFGDPYGVVLCEPREVRS